MSEVMKFELIGEENLFDCGEDRIWSGKLKKGNKWVGGWMGGRRKANSA